MIKEQDKAIERCNKLIEIEHSNWIGTTNQKAIETVLNMLKEKDAEIEKYKKLLADNLARELNNSIKAKEKADTDLDDLDKGWKVELEKKDKMIDLMAKHICDSAIVDDTVCAIKCDCETDIREDCTYEKMLNCTKQYFERKVTNGG